MDTNILANLQGQGSQAANPTANGDALAMLSGSANYNAGKQVQAQTAPTQPSGQPQAPQTQPNIYEQLSQATAKDMIDQIDFNKKARDAQLKLQQQGPPALTTGTPQSIMQQAGVMQPLQAALAQQLKALTAPKSGWQRGAEAGAELFQDLVGPMMAAHAKGFGAVGAAQFMQQNQERLNQQKQLQIAQQNAKLGQLKDLASLANNSDADIWKQMAITQKDTAARNNYEAQMARADNTRAAGEAKQLQQQQMLPYLQNKAQEQAAMFAAHGNEYNGQAEDKTAHAAFLRATTDPTVQQKLAKANQLKAQGHQEEAAGLMDDAHAILFRNMATMKVPAETAKAYADAYVLDPARATAEYASAAKSTQGAQGTQLTNSIMSNAMDKKGITKPAFVSPPNLPPGSQANPKGVMKPPEKPAYNFEGLPRLHSGVDLKNLDKDQAHKILDGIKPQIDALKKMSASNPNREAGIAQLSYFLREPDNSVVESLLNGKQ